jgi:hypothetical protein
MILAAVMLVGAARAGWMVPACRTDSVAPGWPRPPLSRIDFRHHRRRTERGSAVVLPGLPGHGPARPITQALHKCWSALDHWTTATYLARTRYGGDKHSGCAHRPGLTDSIGGSRITAIA